MSDLSQDFFSRGAPELAAALIGARLFHGQTGGIVVETEAYTRGDPASHSYAGMTPRNRSMFGPVGHAYVYRVYGLHWCFNIVCGRPGDHGEAVLVRALEPTEGLTTMRERRGGVPPRDLCRGPGRLCQALGIGPSHDGIDLIEPPLWLSDRTSIPEVVSGPRIGLTKAADVPWRFGLRGSRFLSRGFGKHRLDA